MEKIKNIYKEKTDLINLLIISVLIIVGSLLFHGCFNGILTDKGREMLFPAAILDGKILYKDILCIYFPLAFQINAIGYKLFGINVQTLEMFNTINALITCSALYFITREFLSKNFAFLFAVLTAVGATFNGTLFNLQLPYSCSFTYGISAYLIALFLLIKYLKTDNVKFLPYCYLIAGFSVACKSEFGIFMVILLLTTFVVKPCSIKQNIMNILVSLIFPVISFGILFLQGVSINDLINSFNFMRKFFTTDSMIYHISKTGGIFRIGDFNMYFEYIPKAIGLYLVSYFLFKKTKDTFWVILAITVSACLANFTNIGMNTLLLPLTVLAVLLFKATDIYSDKPLFILILAALGLNLRMFWALVLSTYGIHTAHILLLAFVVLLFKYLPEYKYLSKDDLKQFTKYMLIVYLVFFGVFTIWQQTRNDTPIITPRGMIQIPRKEADVLTYAINYINQFSSPKSKILVLPEGMAINFLTQRDLDYKLPMADRLYYDAIGAEKIIESIKNTDYEMILIAHGHGLTNFGKPFVYSDGNPVYEFIKNNYKLDWETQYFNRADKADTNTMQCFVKPY